MKEYGFFLCLLLRALVIPLHFGFSNAISYFPSVIPAFESIDSATYSTESLSQAICCILCMCQGFAPCLVPNEPHNALCHSLSGILEVISGIHLKHCFNAQLLVVIVQSPGVLLNLCHNPIASPRFPITERQIHLFGKCRWLIQLCELHEARIPH